MSGENCCLVPVGDAGALRTAVQTLANDVALREKLGQGAAEVAAQFSWDKIAAETAVLGGWQAARQGQSREILFVGAGEGLDPLTVRPGLGLVPFAVDVHASQMGTLTRLIHAVELGLVPEGWAIDENTMLVVNGRSHQIVGQGHGYHVQRSGDSGVTVTIHVAA